MIWNEIIHAHRQLVIITAQISVQFFPFVLSLSHSAGYVPIRLLRRKYVKISTMLWYVVNCSSLSLYLLLLVLACSLVRTPSTSCFPFAYAFVLVIPIIRATIYTHRQTIAHRTNFYPLDCNKNVCIRSNMLFFQFATVRDVVCAHNVYAACVCLWAHTPIKPILVSCLLFSFAIVGLCNMATVHIVPSLCRNPI